MRFRLEDRSSVQLGTSVCHLDVDLYVNLSPGGYLFVLGVPGYINLSLGFRLCLLRGTGHMNLSSGCGLVR